MNPRFRLGLLVIVAMVAGLAFLRRRDAPEATSSTPARERGRSVTVDHPAKPTPTPEMKSPLATKPAAGTAALRTSALAKTAAFEDWLTDWRRADSAARPALIASGRDRMIVRRTALRQLIEIDPRLALEKALPEGLRAELPEELQALLERRIDARGDFEVQISCGPNESHTDRFAVIGGERYAAHVFGRRDHQATKFGVPLHGIAIDGSIALDPAPYRELDPVEKAVRGFDPEKTVVLVGDETVSADSFSDLQKLHEKLVAAESVPGPLVLREANAGTPTGPEVPPIAAVTSPASWILGPKRVLWVKVDFSDSTGAVATDAQIAVTNTAVTEFYQSVSQGKTTMTFSILPALLRLPKDKAYYNSFSTSDDELAEAARTLAKQYDAANGGTGTYDPDRYDRWIVLFSNVAIYTFSGKAQTGGPRVKMHGTIAPGIVAHELGHTQSLDHAHYWLPSGSSATGPGTHVEYGDTFDSMGFSTGSANNFFNAPEKAKLGYLESADISAITQSGTYRIGRHDHPDASGVRALKVTPGNVEYEYWFEQRQFGPTNLTTAQLDRLRNGVMVHWGPGKAPRFTSGGGSYLIDGTPGSSAGANDAALRVGETFVDPDAGITLKPLAVGGTTPNEYIDVQVSFGAAAGNRNPVLVANAPSGTINARSNVVFNASATDPDGDPLYFRWDFGDGKVQPQLGSVTTRYTKGGTYTVSVSAHDGRGGIDAKKFTLNVVDPLVNWTQRASGQLLDTLFNVIFAGDRFLAGGLGFVLTSPDGIQWTRTAVGATNDGWSGLAYNGSTYVAVGLRGSGTDRGGVVYSNDGATWTFGTVPAGIGQLTAVAFGANRFVAVGELGRIYTSPDGITWSNTLSPVTNFLRAVAFADGQFVATGDSGRILTSADGIAWLNRSVSTVNSLLNITRHKGAWYTFSPTSECFTSEEGEVWTRIPSSGRTSSMSRVISTAGLLLGANAGGGVYISEDAGSWASQPVDAGGTNLMTGAAEGKGLIAVVGSNGIIYTATAPSPSFSPLIAAPSLRFEADSLKVSVGKKNVLSASGAGFVRLELYANGTKVSDISGSAGAFSWTPAAIGTYSLVVRGVAASGESVVSASYPAKAAVSRWNWRNPSPVGTDLASAVRVDGKWWIVGHSGAFLTINADGTFSRVDFPTTQNLTGIAYANGRFVVSAGYLDSASGEEIGPLWTSTDGYAWTQLLPNDLINLNFVTYAADKWIAGSVGSVLVTSTDGVNWSRPASGLNTPIRGAAFGNNIWVVVAGGGKIISSPDAVRWTERTSGVTTDLNSVTFNNGTFVAAGLNGVILRSTDGITWTRATTGVTTNLYGAGVVAGSFVAVGDSGLTLTSTDASTWARVAMDGKFSSSSQVTSSGDNAIIVGRAGEIFTATTGSPWRRATTGTGEVRATVIYAGGRFVCVTGRIDTISNTTVVPVLRSSDGVSWTRANGNTALNATNLLGLTYAQNTYLAVGDNGRIFTSANATDWTSQTSGTTNALQSVAAGPAGFVAVGLNGTVVSSADGTTWATSTSRTTTTLNCAAYGAGRYVVVGNTGTVIYSEDGSTWNVGTSGTVATLNTVTWVDNIGFLAGGNSGTMLRSDDGNTWQQVETGLATFISSIAQTPVGILASAGLNGAMLLSLDGSSWSNATNPSDRTLRSIAASPTTLITVGDNGTMLGFDFVDSTPPPAIVTPPAPQLVLTGGNATFSVGAQNAFGAVYQWLKDGQPIPGASRPVFAISGATAGNLGRYSVTITSATGAVTSDSAALTFATANQAGRLINLSLLTSLPAAGDSFTMGAVIGGAGTVGTKPLLVRAVGPSLSVFNLSNSLRDPALEFYAGTTLIGENDNWGGTAALREAFAAVGAFPYTDAASRDAAIFNSAVAQGNNSVKISGVAGATGAVLAELYDSTPTDSYTTTTPRLINVSVLKHLGTGVTAGFVVGGSTPRKVLVRAIGPTLAAAPFNVAGTVADPQLALYTGATQIGANDNWGGTAVLSAAFAQVGAFGLSSTSKDAALVAELQPGSYTVTVSGVGGTTGVALVEVYEVP